MLSLLLDLAAITSYDERLVAQLPAKRARTRRLLLGLLQRAREMIEDHRGWPPSLEVLAQASCLSRFHLLRLFKAVFGASPMAYAERCRMERARGLLRHTPLSVAEVAGRLGYESQSAFAKAFRRHAGGDAAPFPRRLDSEGPEAGRELAIPGDTRAPPAARLRPHNRVFAT